MTRLLRTPLGVMNKEEFERTYVGSFKAEWNHSQLMANRFQESGILDVHGRLELKCPTPAMPAQDFTGLEAITSVSMAPHVRAQLSDTEYKEAVGIIKKRAVEFNDLRTAMKADIEKCLLRIEPPLVFQSPATPTSTTKETTMIQTYPQSSTLVVNTNNTAIRYGTARQVLMPKPFTNVGVSLSKTDKNKLSLSNVSLAEEQLTGIPTVEVRLPIS